MEEEQLLIDKERPRKRRSRRMLAAIIIGALEFAVIVCSIIVLAITSSDCERPVRLWLWMSAIVLAVHLSILVLFEVFAFTLHKHAPGNCYIALNVIAATFYFLWTSIGIIWLKDEPNECQDEFEAGWIMAWTSISLFVAALSIAFLILLIIACIACVGTYHLSKLTKTK